MAEFNIIGSSPLRDDGPGKVSGRTEYIADMEIPGCWIGGIVRSGTARESLGDQKVLLLRLVKGDSGDP